MRLLEFQYIGSGWNLNLIQFQPVNLIVGKNAVGKSRLIQGLSNAVQYILQATDNNNDTSFGAIFKFMSEKEYFYYHFSYIKGKVVREGLVKENQDQGLEALLLPSSSRKYMRSPSNNTISLPIPTLRPLASFSTAVPAVTVPSSYFSFPYNEGRQISPAMSHASSICPLPLILERLGSPYLLFWSLDN